jgi:hypothetical protein
MVLYPPRYAADEDAPRLFDWRTARCMMVRLL